MDQAIPSFEFMEIDRLNPAGYNPRSIDEDTLKRIENSIRSHGMVDPIVVNKATGYTVIGGHQRLRVAKKLGWTKVPCAVIEIPESQEKALNIALNNDKAMGHYDFSRLADLLQDIDTGEFDVSSATGFSEKELESIATWTLNERPAADESDKLVARYEVVIECKSESEQKELLDRLTQEGLPCKAVLA